MPKVLTVNPEKCTGCRICELACSVNKEGMVNTSLSRIKVIKWEMEGFYVPMFCQQCEDPLCAAVCPVNAINRDEYLGRVFVNGVLFRIRGDFCMNRKRPCAATCVTAIRSASSSATPGPCNMSTVPRCNRPGSAPRRRNCITTPRPTEMSASCRPSR